MNAMETQIVTATVPDAALWLDSHTRAREAQGGAAT